MEVIMTLNNTNKTGEEDRPSRESAGAGWVRRTLI